MRQIVRSRFFMLLLGVGLMGATNADISVLLTTQTGAPVASAEVALLDANFQVVAEARTNADGVFEVDVAAGAYTLVVSAQGFSTATVEDVVLQVGEQTSVAVAWRPLGESDPRSLERALYRAAEQRCDADPSGASAIFGFVADTTGLALASGAAVTLTPVESGEAQHVTTDSTGFFSFCVAPDAAVVVLAATAPQGETIVRFTVTPGAPGRMDLALAAAELGPQSVFGRVTDGVSGREIADATVRARAIGAVAQTNNRGFFVLNSVPTGILQLEVEHLGYEPQVADVVILAESQMVDFKITPEALSLPEVTVTVRSTNWMRDMSQVYRRMDQGWANYVSGRDLMGKTTFADAVIGTPGVRVRYRGRNRIPVMQNGCVPKVWIDGYPYRIDPFLGFELPMPEPEIVEVFPSIAGIPPEFTDHFGAPVGCAVLIWTKRR
jgi:Carboxypeptidase regulatory-like domain